jgi:Raf kinase inhibitor-like YbhB/YbcL family protein
MALQLQTAAFKPGGNIPARYTCDGPDVSPALAWNGAPAGTLTFAVVMEDPDAPGGTWVHWLMYEVPASVAELPEAVPAQIELPSGARQGRNDFRRVGYGGPCPPRGPAHRYFFRLYALDAKLNVRAGAAKADLDRAMRGHVVAEAELMGRYARV